MSNAVFPSMVGMTIDIDLSPKFSTNIQRSVTGKEYRAALMLSPTYEISLKFEFLRSNVDSEYQQIMGFFIDRQGDFDSFLLDIPDNNSVTNQIIATADGSTTAFQLGRVMGSSLFEPTTNINTLTNVNVNGITKTLGVDFTLSPTGKLLFISAPTTGFITWTGTYYYRCRFDGDTTKFSRIGKTFWENNSIALVGALGSKI